MGEDWTGTWDVRPVQSQRGHSWDMTPLVWFSCIPVALGQGMVGKAGIDSTRPWPVASGQRMECVTALCFCRAFM